MAEPCAPLDDRYVRKDAWDERDRFYLAEIASTRRESTLALAGSEKAISKAETAVEKRFDSVNEFRAQQKDLIGTFATREALSTVEKRLVEIAGRGSGIKEVVSLLGWLAAFAVALYAAFHR